MELLLKRIARKKDYTIGRLYVDGVYVCDTLEDYDRLYFGGIKESGKTAIPVGRYRVLLNSYSPRFGQKEPYKSLQKGCVPLISGVPGFSGVRIHIGNTASDTDGCPLVGRNKVVGQVTESRVTYINLVNKYLNPAKTRGEAVWITVQ